MKQLVVLPVIMAAACVAPYETVEVSSKRTALSSTLRMETEQLLSYNLLDPEAVRFRGIQGYALSNGDTAVCGEFNGVNRYGAYVGFKQFYVRWRPTSPISNLKSIKYEPLSNMPCRTLSSGSPLEIGTQ